ncbi:hypothetical protein Y032_0029g1936 [Ancylostoma ceylanicum]|uniref:Endonuclease/exonuclease/phosphatase domain-containing protein n=1 Tax=Ancylostoma ceylanicum TaxID=53326 RepID=A0A016URP5_9BILA|nr:hypothetical protein Y032_0029g1936 [Ancylostoma ceylanicum]
MRIISAYAPQVGCTSEEKSSFYEDLEQYVHTIGDEEVLLLGGDLNGHVGEEREGFNRWHGGYGYARVRKMLRNLEKGEVVGKKQFVLGISHPSYKEKG